MIDVEFLEYPSVEEMVEATALAVAAIIEAAIVERDQALLAFPGGNTPKPIMAELAAAKLQWERVTIFPGDERLVPRDHRLSNCGTLESDFASTGARIVPLAGENADYREAGKLADKRLHQLEWPPDLVWLGMGMDGHTASIFPGPDLENALNGPTERRAVGVMPDPLPVDAPVARVTLTKAAIVEARSLMITISGPSKRELIVRAIAGGQSSPYPIGNVIAYARRRVQIFCSN
ncbi:MAG: 6-phosphogluconolactonase [Sphingomicrobium sp.]